MFTKRRPDSRWAYPVQVALLALLWTTAIAAWCSWKSAPDLRMQLASVSPYVLLVTALIMAVAVYSSRHSFPMALASVPRRQWVVLLLIAGLAVVLSHAVAPRIHRIFYDEDIYESIGLDMAYNNHAAMANDGGWTLGKFEIRRLYLNKEPNAWPFLISLVFRICGPHEPRVFDLTNLLFAVSVGLVFLAGALLFQDALAGLFAAAVYALVPDNIRWFATIAAEPAAACFGIAAVVSLLFFLRTRSKGLLYVTAAVTAFASQFRPESLLVIAVLCVLVCVESPSLFKDRQLYWPLVLGAALLVAHFVHLYVVRGESWGASGPKFSLSYFPGNFKANTLYFLGNRDIPIQFIVLAAIGLLDRRRVRHSVFLAFWFLVFWTLFLFFYAGGYRYNANERFALGTIAPLTLLAGWGARRMVSWISRFTSERSARVILGACLALTLAAWLPSLRELPLMSWESRDDHRTAEHFATLVPRDAIVMTHDPVLFHLAGKDACQTSVFTEDMNHVENYLMKRYKDKIYLHWDYWCNVNEPVQPGYTKRVLQNYQTVLIEEQIIQGKPYALYRIGEKRMKPVHLGEDRRPVDR